jgi:hypothetical protein
MKKHTLIGVAEPENVTHLFAVEPFDIPQNEHSSLVFRQLRDRIFQLRAQLGIQDAALG